LAKRLPETKKRMTAKHADHPGRVEREQGGAKVFAGRGKRGKSHEENVLKKAAGRTETEFRSQEARKWAA
jgi:hypothetical protein